MKKAFSLIELVMVIVVVGIIAIVAIPRFQRDNLQEAADQILSHIRYTQQLAMLDNKFNPKDETWYKARWQIFFANTKETGDEYSYTVFSDYIGKKSGFPNLEEIAQDFANPKKLLTGGYSGSIEFYDERVSKNLRIGKFFDIKDIKFKRLNGATRIVFDEIGRPYSAVQNSTNSTDKILKEPCIIILTDNSGKNKSITVCNETGYAFILPSDVDIGDVEKYSDKICNDKK
ncbi:putative type II secretion system protein [Campylobacter sputorum bv. paraureolyticus LMG 11764]|uniref:prepilin-type N-terminal cleavage/methylation domain-containing protein n=1 Tax=Campylobacter sputorum TaxID=206 RepID=UPI000B774685|nr:prepilin-type N-terminal cleavage/methylation domain-containing protein [Campylobacter sputorum]ASM38200.1 putative type II secretion system protein [Campylobacter sputorum bv. paraureolyticus LMG 11764]